MKCGCGRSARSSSRGALGKRAHATSVSFVCVSFFYRAHASNYDQKNLLGILTAHTQLGTPRSITSCCVCRDLDSAPAMLLRLERQQPSTACRRALAAAPPPSRRCAHTCCRAAGQKHARRSRVPTDSKSEPLVVNVEPDGSDAWRLEPVIEILKAGGVRGVCVAGSCFCVRVQAAPSRRRARHNKQQTNKKGRHHPDRLAAGRRRRRAQPRRRHAPLRRARARAEKAALGARTLVRRRQRLHARLPRPQRAGPGRHVQARAPDFAGAGACRVFLFFFVVLCVFLSHSLCVLYSRSLAPHARRANSPQTRQSPPPKTNKNSTRSS